MKVTIKLFGLPEIALDGKPVTLALKKSEAMLYYIAYEQKITRDSLVGLMWSDLPLEVAKKNIRNSLYRIKKDLGFDVFTHLSKHIIAMSQEVAYLCDAHGDDDAFLKTYKGHFLEGFYVKDSERYNAWRFETEQMLNQKFARLAKQALQGLLDKGEADRACEVALTLRRMDPYDEEAVRWLMRIHDYQGQYKQVTEVYAELKALLEEDMGIKPDAVTRQLYYEMLQRRATEQLSRESLFGREQEMDRLTAAMNGFLKRGTPRMMVIEGEAGIGKTKLLGEVISQLGQRLQMFHGCCYWVEEGYAYKVWNGLLGDIYSSVRGKKGDMPVEALATLSKIFPSVVDDVSTVRMANIETLKLEYIENLICQWFIDMTAAQPMLLVIDDIQWMDERSMTLLLGVLLRVEGLACIATRRKSESDKMRHFLMQLEKKQLLETISLQRFSDEKTCEFLVHMVGDGIRKQDRDAIVKASEGNPFFILEYANLYLRQDGSALTRVKNVIEARLLEVSPEALKVLTLLAMFFDGVTFQNLNDLYSKDVDALVALLDELKAKDFIFEHETSEDSRFDFTHQKLREHLLERTPPSMRRVLHNRIALLLEGTLKMDNLDIYVLQNVIYHYKNGKNTIKHLQYALLYLSEFFDFSHELYPEARKHFTGFANDAPDQYFQEVEHLLDKASEDEAAAYRAQYVYLRARYHIRNGDYADGLKCIDTLESLCQRLNDDVFRFKALVQRVYYYIQTEQTQELHAMLTQMASLPKTPKQEAVYYRYCGIEKMYSSDFQTARAFFKASLRAFEALNDDSRYALNMAACYNYISETYMKEKNYARAFEDVQKAIDICARYGIFRGQSIFRTNAGILCYEMGAAEKAKKYLQEALEYFDKIDSLWRRSEAEGYLALIALEGGDIEEGSRLLELAKAHAYKMHSPVAIRLMEMLDIKIQTLMDK